MREKGIASIAMMVILITYGNASEFNNALQITRNTKQNGSNNEDLFDGHDCKITSHNTGTGQCRCNYKLNTYFAQGNSTFFCYNDRNILTTTSCTAFHTIENTYGIKDFKHIKMNNIQKNISLERVDLWNYVRKTRKGLWDITWSKSLLQIFSISGNNIYIHKNNKKLDGFLLRLWITSTQYRQTCVLIAFVGTASYPLKSIEDQNVDKQKNYSNQTLSPSTTVPVQGQENKTASNNQTVYGKVTSAPMRGSSGQIPQSILIAFISLACVSVLGVIIIAVIYRKLKINRGTSEKDDRFNEVSVYDQTKPKPKDIDENDDGHYKELTEEYQYYETYYKSLNLTENHQNIPVYNEINYTGKDSQTDLIVYHVLEEPTSIGNTDYHEVEPEYREVEHQTYEAI